MRGSNVAILARYSSGISEPAWRSHPGPSTIKNSLRVLAVRLSYTVKRGLVLRGFRIDSRNVLDAGDKECGQIMLTTIRLLNCDLRHIICRGEHEVWVLDPVFAPVRHANNERLKRHEVK